MKFLLANCIVIILTINSTAQIQICKTTNIHFFSATPVEDIEANCKTGVSALNTQTGKIFVKGLIKTFEFEKALMQEHFNENYLESSKYPEAEFDGTIINLPDLNNDGEYKVKIAGSFKLHGVTKTREIEATLIVKEGKITGSSRFKVKCADHNIEIPKLVVKNIAEEIEVDITANFTKKS